MCSFVGAAQNKDKQKHKKKREKKTRNKKKNKTKINKTNRIRQEAKKMK